MILVPRSHDVELKKSCECKKTYYGMLMNLGHISLGSNPCYGKQSIKHPMNWMTLPVQASVFVMT